jgi:hypothetical protein
VHLVGFHYKDISLCTVLWMSKAGRHFPQSSAPLCIHFPLPTAYFLRAFPYPIAVKRDGRNQIKRAEENEDPVRCVHIALRTSPVSSSMPFGTVRCQAYTITGLHRIQWTCSHALNMIRGRRTLYIQNLKCPNTLSLYT